MLSDDICIDLLVEIFKRLPPKSIIRFRSLSKYWHSCLVRPDFLHDHRHRCSKTPQKVIVSHLSYCGNSRFKNMYSLHSADQLPFGPGSGRTPIPGFEFPHDVEVIGSCNGIVCLLNNTRFILCNFSVRRKLIVPRHHSYNFTFYVALGFGFDPITDDYKIVGIDLYNKYTHIYSLKTDSWSGILSPSDLPAVYKFKPNPCFFNGILHWVVVDHHTNPSYYIFTFNMSSHVFGRILFPGRIWGVQQVTTINGCLAVISGEFEPKKYSWLIWAMKEYNKVESWCRLSSGFQTKPGSLIRVVQPVINGDVLAYYYGPKGYELHVMCERLNSKPKFLKLGIERYVESLELLDQERATTCGETIFSWSKTGVKYYRIRF